MNYGLIGERLTHSFSKEIHGMIADYEYELKEIAKNEISSFLESRDFNAINVTIPYKETVIPYLDYIDDKAKLIGSVNTVVNRGGKLFGYNTDFYGMSELARHAGIDFSDKKVVILGTGGTSKTARAVASSLGAREIILVGRSGRDGSVSYEELYRAHTDAEVIINTTPVGMFPNTDDAPVDISLFDRLSGVIDAVYNPLKTRLILDASERGISSEGGLYMLVAQAVKASEIFLDTVYPKKICDSAFRKIVFDKSNIVLIGMPASGKSTVGKIIAKRLGREFIDTDTVIEEKAKKSIPDIFADEGEVAFRNLEESVISEISTKTCSVIATGGGTILRESNLRSLRKNGKLYFLDRPLDMLIPTSDRPLSSTKADIERRYSERYEKYISAADVKTDASADALTVAESIINVVEHGDI